jgi:hypothetical protein
MRSSIARLFAVAIVPVTALIASAPAHAVACNVTVPVGASVEAAVNAASPGTFICLRGGVHSVR